MNPWLTAIVPVHDGAQHLRATLAAAAAERPDGVEFLLYDSSDDNGACRLLAKEFADRLNLRYVATPECKPWTSKTNRGAAEALAPHLVMLHQDDLWLPGHIAALRTAIERAPDAVMSIASSHFVDDQGCAIGRWRLPFRAGLHRGSAIAATLIVQNTIAIPSPAIRRDAWLAVSGMDESLWYTADWDLYLKLSQYGDVDVRPATTTAFRLHRGSLTMTGSRKQSEFSAQQEIVLERHLPKLQPKSRIRQEPLARASIAVNCALAARAAQQTGPSVRALSQLFCLGPIGIGRFLAATRLIDRILPRLRLSFKGALAA
ncbi:MAG: glycosyltransferase family 2 protein [Sphingobium sp.]